MRKILVHSCEQGLQTASRKQLMKLKPVFFILSIVLFLSDTGYSRETIPFIPGESLRFSIKFGPITGGFATVRLSQTYYSGKVAFHSVARGKTTGVTDVLFNVEDLFISYFNPENCLPYKSIRDITEGRYTFYNETRFYHDSNRVFSQKSGIHEIPEGTLDIVSTFYWLRKKGFEDYATGDTIPIVTFFDDELFPFDIVYKGTETITTRLGTFECFLLGPVVEPGRIFKSEDDMHLWLSKDDNLIPIRVKFDLIVGSLKMDLISYENLKHALIPIQEK